MLLAPAGKQQFIYTTPGGGFDFAFRLCLYTGIALSIPVIVYQLLYYLRPLVKKNTMRFIKWASVWSGTLAAVGLAFGYFVGLPAGLHFLLQGFSTTQIKALISIQSYLSFVMVYLLGSALLFQIPLILLFANRIKPLRPKALLAQQRWVILVAFVLGAIISPSPDIRNQAILSGPIILMYDASIVMIWVINRRHRKPKKVAELLRKDAEARAQRLTDFQKAQALWTQTFKNASLPSAEKVLRPTPVNPSPQVVARPNRPQQYLNSFNRQPYSPLDNQPE